MRSLVVGGDVDGQHAVLCRTSQLAVAPDGFHFVLLHEEVETLGMLGHDLRFAFLDGRQFSLRASTPSMPNSLASFRWSQISALNSRALVGIQPTCRQVPPRTLSFSMRAVFRPYWPARMAAVYPAGPLPMMAMS